jgi:hypothetical protein
MCTNALAAILISRRLLPLLVDGGYLAVMSSRTGIFINNRAECAWPDGKWTIASLGSSRAGTAIHSRF